MFRRLLSLYLTIIMLFGVFIGNPLQIDEGFSKAVSEYLEQKGVAGYLYSREGKYFYTASEPWQRALGFNSLYDAAAPYVVMFYDTERFDFEYENKDWRIQFWKGQYGWIFIGGEIGIYTKPTYRHINQYDCAEREDWLPMSFELVRFNHFKLFKTPHEERWWCTGFIPGSLVIFSWRSQLKMNCVLTMKDAQMRTGFTKALTEKGYSYTIDGLDVHMVF